jgi:hypothetical protein
MKSERPEIEKTKLAGNVPLEDNVINILGNITAGSTVLDIHGGMGRVSEYLLSKECVVTLVEPNPLGFAYRRSIVPNSTVRCWNIEGSSIKLDKPTFDYVIVRGTEHYQLAKKIAKKGIVDLITEEFENVVPDSETPTPAPETVRVADPYTEAVTGHILPSVPETQSDTVGVPGVESVVDME